MNQSNLGLTQKIYQGFATGNMQPLFESITDNTLWNSHSHPTSPFHGVHKGAKEIEKYFSNMGKVELHKFDLLSMVESGNKVIILFDVERTIKENGIKNTGQFVHILEFQDDKIIQADIYEASAEL
jgi:ketosteroid isomerase-like protein